MPFGKWYKNFFLSLVGVVVSLLFLEAGLRVYLRLYPDKAAGLFLEPAPAAFGLELVASNEATRITQGDAEDYQFVFHPYLTYKNLPDQHGQGFNVNSLGLRGGDVSLSKDPDVFRVVVVGGSTAFGIGVTDDTDLWTYKLQQKLNACPSFTQRVEVLNAAVIGYLTWQELLYLQLELLDLAPDLIIAFDGYNDFANPAYATNGCTLPLSEHFAAIDSVLFGHVVGQLRQHASERQRTILSRIGGLLGAMATKTYIGKFFYKRLQTLPGPSARTPLPERPRTVFADSAEAVAAEQPPDAECVAGIASYYQKNLQKMARLVNGRGIPLVLALQPEVSFKRKRSPAENEIIKDEAQSWTGYDQAIAHIYPRMAAAARTVAERNPMTTFLDLRDVFGDRSEDVFVDACHLNDLGHEIVAQSLSDHLCQHK